MSMNSYGNMVMMSNEDYNAFLASAPDPSAQHILNVRQINAFDVHGGGKVAISNNDNVRNVAGGSGARGGSGGGGGGGGGTGGPSPNVRRSIPPPQSMGQSVQPPPGPGAGPNVIRQIGRPGGPMVEVARYAVAPNAHIVGHTSPVATPAPPAMIRQLQHPPSQDIISRQRNNYSPMPASPLTISRPPSHQGQQRPRVPGAPEGWMPEASPRYGLARDGAFNSPTPTADDLLNEAEIDEIRQGLANLRGREQSQPSREFQTPTRNPNTGPRRISDIVDRRNRRPRFDSSSGISVSGNDDPTDITYHPPPSPPSFRERGNNSPSMTAGNAAETRRTTAAAAAGVRSSSVGNNAAARVSKNQQRRQKENENRERESQRQETVNVTVPEPAGAAATAAAVSPASAFVHDATAAAAAAAAGSQDEVDDPLLTDNPYRGTSDTQQPQRNAATEIGRGRGGKRRGGRGGGRMRHDSESTMTLPSGPENDFQSSDFLPPPDPLNQFSTVKVGQYVGRPPERTPSSGYGSRFGSRQRLDERDRSRSPTERDDDDDAAAAANGRDRVRPRVERQVRRNLFPDSWISPEQQAAHIRMADNAVAADAAANAAADKRRAQQQQQQQQQQQNAASIYDNPTPGTSTGGYTGQAARRGGRRSGGDVRKKRFSMQKTVTEIRKRAMELLDKRSLFTKRKDIELMIENATAAAREVQAAGVEGAHELIDVNPASEGRMDAAVQSLVEMEEEAREAREQNRRPPRRRPGKRVAPGGGEANVAGAADGSQVPRAAKRVVQPEDNFGPAPWAPKRLRFSQGEASKRLPTTTTGRKKRKKAAPPRKTVESSTDDNDDSETDLDDYYS